MSVGSQPRAFNFGAGNPDPGVFPAKELGEAAQRILSRVGTELAHYPDPMGLPELRAVAVERFERNHGVRPPLEHVVITNGAMQGLQLSAQGLARPGDSVVLEEFEYGGTIRVFKQLGLRLVGVPLDDHGMRMVEDDTYGDISFEPQPERAIYTLAEPGEVMYIGSFSKILGPGIRLGFFIAPPSIAERLMPWKTDGGTSALSQLIAAEYFNANLWSHVEEGRAAVKDKRNVLLDALEGEFGAMDGMHWSQPDGGLFVWIKLPDDVDRLRLRDLATARHITYATGQAFHANNEDVPYLRLAFGWIERGDIADGVRLLADCIRESMPARSPALR